MTANIGNIHKILLASALIVIAAQIAVYVYVLRPEQHGVDKAAGMLNSSKSDLRKNNWPANIGILTSIKNEYKAKLEGDDEEEKSISMLYDMAMKRAGASFSKKIEKEYAYIIEELLGSNVGDDRFSYRKNIIDSIIDSGEVDDYITAMAHLIRDLSIYKIHVLGDLFDRGPGGDVVVNLLMNQHDVDITWGNHDILWMGAAAGNKACIANVIRICARYDNLHTLEVGYGISLRPLVTFAMKVYGEDDCKGFKTNISFVDAMHDTEIESLRRIGKAIAIMQFKLEGQLIAQHPHYEMDALRLLDKVDYKKNTVTVDGKVYPMTDSFFPTIDPKDPYKLTAEEAAVMDRLQAAFLESRILQEHIKFLFDKGGIYRCVNGNLLFHGSMPLTESGKFDSITTGDGKMRGKKWFDYADRLVRTGYFGRQDDKDKQRGIDFMWYLWCGYKSPLFGKKKITTFERLFIEDEATWKEDKNPYYTLMDDPKICKHILDEFGCSGVIINGHMPVKKGKNPVHAGGKAIVIDGGFAKAYQKTTGIAGYSLVHNSYGFILSAHQAFDSKHAAISEDLDIHSTQVANQRIKTRILNKDTDTGSEMQERIDALKELIKAYRSGVLAQKH
ncbi:MAG: fructose-bisphosphatase class III [Firmicutes bacterium]|nr:fructose-bisphosphatase class III [Bacillota bacterium]